MPVAFSLTMASTRISLLQTRCRCSGQRDLRVSSGWFPEVLEGFGAATAGPAVLAHEAAAWSACSRAGSGQVQEADGTIHMKQLMVLVQSDY